MAKFGEEMRCILADVAKFLRVTLKRVTLPPGASSQRLSLMNKLDELQHSYPQLHWELEDDDPENGAVGSNGTYNQVIFLAARDIMNPAKRGFLNQKTQGGRLIKTKTKKVWCIVKDGIFYGYEKQTSKSQNFSFPLKGYEVKTSSTKVENVLELMPRNGTALQYTFVVADHGELQSWSTVLSTQVHVTADERMSVSFDDEYEYSHPPPIRPLPAKPPAVCGDAAKETSNLSSQTSDSSTSKPPDRASDIYEDLSIFEEDADDVPETSKPVISPDGKQGDALKPSLVPQQDGNRCDTAVAANSKAVTPLPKPVVRKRPAVGKDVIIVPPVSSPLATTSGTEHDVDVKKLDELATSGPSSTQQHVQETPAGQNPVVMPRNPRRQNEPPTKRESQPSLDLPTVVISQPEPEVYVTEWDCTADADNELSFLKGERLLVVSRQYEHLGWLVAEKIGNYSGRKTGLIPKDYVSKAT